MTENMIVVVNHESAEDAWFYLPLTDEFLAGLGFKGKVPNPAELSLALAKFDFLFKVSRDD